MTGKEYSLTEQLTELRKRIILVILIWVAASVVLYAFIDPFIERILDAVPEVPVIFITPSELFLTKIRISTGAGLVLTFPILALQAGLFIFPALYRSERKIVVIFLAMTMLFAAGGGFFAWRVVLPSVLRFFTSISHPEIRPVFDFREYIDFIVGTILVFSVVFETPVIFRFLGKMGIIDSCLLRKVRKYFYLSILAISAVITPPDPLTMLMLAIPFFLLYEFGIILVSFRCWNQ